jgi:hypothetical protein
MCNPEHAEDEILLPLLSSFYPSIDTNLVQPNDKGAFMAVGAVSWETIK